MYGRGGHLGHVTKFRAHYPRRLHIKFGFGRSSGFREDLSAVWTTTDGRRTYEPLAQVCSRQGVEIYVHTDKPTDRHLDIHSDS